MAQTPILGARAVSPVPTTASSIGTDPSTTGSPGGSTDAETSLTEIYTLISTISSTSGATPYYIAVGSNFTVPLYRQALYNHAITIDGTLTVDGLLIFVS